MGFCVKKRDYLKLKSLFESSQEKFKMAMRKAQLLRKNIRWLKTERYLNSTTIYSIGKEMFFIAEKWIGTDACYLYPFCLSNSNTSSRNCVCSSIIELHGDHSMIEITTLNAKERRCGHASRQLDHMIALAKTHGITTIGGLLKYDTMIGLDALKKFYQKNGFIISGNGIKMTLK